VAASRQSTASGEWWDSHYLTFSKERSDGSVVSYRLYTIGALAEAVGKSIATIRRWLAVGILPEPKLRTPAIPRTLGNAGRRLWTRQQIQAIADLAVECGVANNSRPDCPCAPFSVRVWTLYRAHGW